MHHIVQKLNSLPSQSISKNVEQLFPICGQKTLARGFQLMEITCLQTERSKKHQFKEFGNAELFYQFLRNICTSVNIQ